MRNVKRIPILVTAYVAWASIALLLRALLGARTLSAIWGCVAALAIIVATFFFLTHAHARVARRLDHGEITDPEYVRANARQDLIWVAPCLILASCLAALESALWWPLLVAPLFLFGGLSLFASMTEPGRRT